MFADGKKTGALVLGKEFRRHHSGTRTKKCLLFVIVLCVVVWTLFLVIITTKQPVHLSYGKSNKLNGTATCENVDVVYTWVNGTDPALIKVWEEVAGKKMSAAGMRRLRDYGILRFSVRSIEKYVPFARNIIFVTNGQVPSWYDDSPDAKHNGRIVTHRQIFPSPPTDLPTFNSNAIEANLRNIPGLPECVLYLNDDFFVGRPLKITDFVAKDGTLRLCKKIATKHTRPQPFYTLHTLSLNTTSTEFTFNTNYTRN